MCEVPSYSGNDCGDFDLKKTRTCEEEEDGSCIKFSKGDATYFSCERFGFYVLGSVPFNSSIGKSLDSPTLSGHQSGIL